ncbi:MBL fold metallo-hydrolase [Neobacillus niacini]|uniref:MBL fold metallo-hydrolase n=1 Tax=Neobacillus niacini TaxID=86668 RepID=UPI002FFF5603
MTVEINKIHKFILPTPFLVGEVNAYLIEGETLTLVDTGPNTEEAWKSFLFQLNKAGFSLDDIGQIIITHHHVDHYGSVDRIIKKRDIPVLGHPRSQLWVSRDVIFTKYCYDFFSLFYEQMGVPGDKLDSYTKYKNNLEQYSCEIKLSGYLTEGMSIPGLSDWVIYETPGHAQSHLVLYRKTDGILLAGDHIIKKISSNAMIEPPDQGKSNRPKPLIQYRQSLKKCSNLDVSYTFSGHGEDVVNLSPLIDIRIKKQNYRAEKIRTLLSEEPQTPFQICQKMFPSVYEEQLPLTMSEVIGHIDLLIEEEKIISKNNSPQFVYKAIE